MRRSPPSTQQPVKINEVTLRVCVAAESDVKAAGTPGGMRSAANHITEQQQQGNKTDISDRQVNVD